MARPIAVFRHPDCQLHDTGPHHPERADRVLQAERRLRASALNPWIHWQTAVAAETKWIELVHSPEYRQFIEESCLSGRTSVDLGETAICEDSYYAACLAVGAAIGAVDTVLAEGYRAAFSLMRPPGHHAGRDRAMGFCMFNNVAIAARYAQVRHRIERICILDWDVHHGNGTQDIFYSSPSVLFCSLHQLPLYPHSGEFEETGLGAGKGLTINSPLTKGSTLDQFMEALQQDIRPAVERFRPELLLISAGFDAHRLDPLADLSLQSEDYAVLTRMVLEMANKSCRGRLVSVLEGGYHIASVAESIEAHLQALIEWPEMDD